MSQKPAAPTGVAGSDLLVLTQSMKSTGSSRLTLLKVRAGGLAVPFLSDAPIQLGQPADCH